MKNVKASSLLLLSMLGLPTAGSQALELESTAVYQSYEIGFWGLLDIENPLQKPAVYDARIERMEGTTVYGDFSSLPEVEMYAHVTDSAQALGKVARVYDVTATSIRLEYDIDGFVEGDRLTLRPYLRHADIAATPAWPELAGIRVNVPNVLEQKTYSWRDGRWTDAGGNDVSDVLIHPGITISILNGRNDFVDRTLNLSGEMVTVPWN